jgi:hypothetical protein
LASAILEKRPNIAMRQSLIRRIVPDFASSDARHTLLRSDPHRSGTIFVNCFGEMISRHGNTIEVAIPEAIQAVLVVAQQQVARFAFKY